MIYHNHWTRPFLTYFLVELHFLIPVNNFLPQAREKELGNQNIYAQNTQHQQRGRDYSKRAMKSGPSQTSLSESKSTSKLSAVAEPSPRNATQSSRRTQPSRTDQSWPQPSRTESSHTEQPLTRQSQWVMCVTVRFTYYITNQGGGVWRK